MKSIVFFGTPEFASFSLEAIHNSGIEVKAVVTAPDRPAGRGYELQESDCKKAAKSLSIPVLQPEKLRNEEFVEELKSLKADLFVVVAFRMLPKVIWSLPELGTINLHASLLPQYRGAAPINYAIINGEKETGVTSFLIDDEIDTGGILLQKAIPIAEDENVGSLYDRLKHLGADLLIETINKLFNSTLSPTSQKEYNEEDLNFAYKISKSDCRIDWTKPMKDVYNLIRGMSPYPAAFTEIQFGNLKAERLKIFKASPTDIVAKENMPAVKLNKEELLIACGDYYIRILELQRAGKRRMSFAEFVSGINTDESCTII